jgi:hypothetical protein
MIILLGVSLDTFTLCIEMAASRTSGVAYGKEIQVCHRLLMHQKGSRQNDGPNTKMKRRPRH